MKRTTKTIIAIVCFALCLLIFASCSEADRVNYNISKQANYFDCERRITVYNARTDKVILEAEGYMSISNNGTHTDPYHYKMYFHTEFPVDVEVKP